MFNVININIVVGLLIPFIGTMLGSSMVFFLKEKMSDKLEKVLLGFASGVMLAASVWSLIIPAIEMSSNYGSFKFVPAAVGFVLGMLFLLLLDTIVPHLHVKATDPEGITNPKKTISRKGMLLFAVTLHNIPEGMAVGVMFSGLLSGNEYISLAGAFALSVGIAIQNFPEGAIISMPLVGEGLTKKKSFLYGSLSGIVEPIFGLVAICLISLINNILPYTLSFAAGAMIYVIVEELIPSSQVGKHSNLGTIGVMIGFTLMMILDVSLG